MKEIKTYPFVARAVLILSLLAISTATFSQEKKLKEVKIRPKKQSNNVSDVRLKSFASGMKILTIDSQLIAQYQQQNLGVLLSQQVPVFIKSYGINSIATLNFRGSSAAQSQVLWNGIPLNSASSGITDVSTLSVGNFDNINIVYGGSSALLGSGNVGAAILLENSFSKADTAKKWGIKIGSELGSFGQRKWTVQQQYSNKKLFVSARIMQQHADNNFEYQNENGLLQKMNNAQLKSVSAIINVGYKIDSQSNIQFSAWYQQFNREIPPALFEQHSVKNQTDKALRLFLGFEKENKILGKFYSKSAFQKDEMLYEDASILMRTENKTQQFYQEFGWKKSLNHQQEILLFIPITIAWMRPSLDTNTRFQNRLGLAACYSIKALRERLQFAFNSRFEKINTTTVLLVGSNASFAAHPFLKFRINVQKSYRAPTLNEWYFQPGGNINLKPENGWNTDFGYELKVPLRKDLLLKHDLSVFDRNIKDWILWFGGSIWTPHNIAQVHSRGLESFNSLHWTKKNWQAQIGINTSFVLATTVKSYQPNDGSINKQIPYSPRYNGQANLGIGYKKFSLKYNHTYTGYRFITTDESQYLEPYQTGNIFTSYDFLLKKLKLQINVQCNNFWNEKYQVVNLRPMPLRNWAIGITASF